MKRQVILIHKLLENRTAMALPIGIMRIIDALLLIVFLDRVPQTIEMSFLTWRCTIAEQAQQRIEEIESGQYNAR